MQTLQIKKQRISEIEQKRLIYKCKCGKKYKSDSALCNHINIKHRDNKNEFKQFKNQIGDSKRGRRINEQETQENIPLNNFQLNLNIIDQIQITLFFVQKKTQTPQNQQKFIEEADIKKMFPTQLFVFEEDYLQIYNSLDSMKQQQEKKYEQLYEEFNPIIDSDLNSVDIMAKFIIEVGSNITQECLNEICIFIAGINFTLCQIEQQIQKLIDFKNEQQKNLFQIQYRNQQNNFENDVKYQNLIYYIPQFAQQFMETYFPLFLDRVKQENYLILKKTDTLVAIFYLFSKWLLINQFTEQLPESKYRTIFKS